MPLSDSIRDSILSLQVAASALASYCEVAKENANDGNLQTDPLMSSVRRGFLQVQAIGAEFLTLDRPSSVIRATKAQIDAAIDASTLTAGVKTTAKNLFDAGKTYSSAQFNNLIATIISSGDMTSQEFNSIRAALLY